MHGLRNNPVTFLISKALIHIKGSKVPCMNVTAVSSTQKKKKKNEPLFLE